MDIKNLPPYLYNYALLLMSGIGLIHCLEVTTGLVVDDFYKFGIPYALVTLNAIADMYMAMFPDKEIVKDVDKDLLDN